MMDGLCDGERENGERVEEGAGRRRGALKGNPGGRRRALRLGAQRGVALSRGPGSDTLC